MRPSTTRRKRRSGVPAASSEAARHRMEAARGWNTGPELALRSALHRLGLRYRIHRRVVPEVRRQVDVVFGPPRVAVFVDGCFWHGCPIHGSMPKANAAFWRSKLAANRRRDDDTDSRLRAAGWYVVRVWEHEPPDRAARRVAQAVRRRR